MMWKPTKFGQYLLNGSIATVILRDDRLLVWDASRDLPDVQCGPWSLLAPDWQLGAPTVAQLERWQWWAIWGGSGQMMVAGMVAELRLDYVIRSAPIQPNMSNGPLWVPLEVCK